jgi:iron(II)-dependent oxidoreductase
MILIPAGWFMMGTREQDVGEMVKKYGWRGQWFADEMPQHPVSLNAYYLDETPVTNAEYKRFLDAHLLHPIPPDWSAHYRDFAKGRDAHPVVDISYNDALEYARWVGKRLPTEAEWEKGARGTEGLRFPWGNEFDADRCNTKVALNGGTTPVTEYAPQGNSPYGVMDMVGNVWEWCADWYAADYYKHSPTHNPTGPEASDWRVLRGGAWDLSPDYARCASREYIVPEGQGYALVGFRCVAHA